MLQVKPDRVLSDLHALAEFGRTGQGVDRRALTVEDRQARDWLRQHMQAAGLDTEIDGVGNVVGRTPRSRRHVIIGSHTDSVPKGGWLDGAMGVMFGLEIARAWMESGTGADTGVEVISFSDEEGRFAGLMGSSVFCGLRDPDAAMQLRADDGTTLGAALAAAGYAGRGIARLEPQRHAAYLEAHIEQGPVLEQAGCRIGIVTGIVGVERVRVTFSGRSDHAGTTPMTLRRDAAGALYEFAVKFAAVCRDQGSPGTVWNLGSVHLDPGAYNVVAARAELGVEFRDGTAAVLDRIRAEIPALAAGCAARYNAGWSLADITRTTPATMDAQMMTRLERAAQAHGITPLRMPSGAGHDAMLFASRIPTGMLFVPSIGGRSHDTSEDTDPADIELGLRVFAAAVDELIHDTAGVP